MAPSKIRKALGAVKDQTSIGLAKVSTASSFISDLDVAIVKATRHDEYPAEEKHIREILSLTCYSRNYISQCVCTLSRRLSKTRSWSVALKTLVLVHRLLTDGDPTYEQEIFFATKRGTRMLNLSDFRDTSRSDAWDYSAFVRTYARYLDEMLEYRMHGRRGRSRSRSRSRSQQMHDDMTVDEEEEEEVLAHVDNSKALTVVLTPVRDIRSTEKIFSRAQHLQQLLDRFLACRPTGSAKDNRIVAVALYPVLKESFQLYSDLQEVMAALVDRFADLEVPQCVRVHDVFARLSKQFDELDLFYSWCKTAGISRPSEFPDVERIPQQKLDVMDEFIRDKSTLPSTSRKSFKSFEELTCEEDARREADAAAAAEASSQVMALPAPEPEPEEEVEQQQEEERVAEEQPLAIVKVDDEEVDFLNLRADPVAVQDSSDNLALALFDGQTAATTSAWETFGDDTADWETALVQTASNLSGNQASLGGGFDMLLLNGMYSQPRQAAAMGFADGGGSASSIVLPGAGVPMLALPAPASTSGAAVGGDPFAASLSVPPPSYVQMTELGRKQRLLVEEQAMWQQYADEGMQGQGGMARLQQAQAAGLMHHHAGYNYQGF